MQSRPIAPSSLTIHVSDTPPPFCPPESNYGSLNPILPPSPSLGGIRTVLRKGPPIPLSSPILQRLMGAAAVVGLGRVELEVGGELPFTLFLQNSTVELLWFFSLS